MTAKMRAWVGGVVAGAALVGLAVYLAAVGLDAADKSASVAGLFVAIAGLVVAVTGPRREHSPQGGQSLANSEVNGGAAQVSNIGGNVRITRRGRPAASLPPVAPVPPPSGGAPTGGDGQRVRDSMIVGPVDQVRDTTGDVDIEEGP
ncbi:hypothetical protein OIC43_08400 [Streptomyces sp. NBC_00825]|uniref:hypothetical protein n=1 Tax=unclassified Streptomyces TaxID=2593676 RepID=UPI002ED65590|nr:hypothetical protein OG832_35305 [Streptomyces sp. NBC_00826]WTH89081.1 hypothetical protein OIC43_08400 [Streptomyces sp. NBC_00825]WTH97809.1 hypothetical protein OHA23_08405 [Streptomyces sp. NBC_00822]